jgi:hypothetical protein
MIYAASIVGLVVPVTLILYTHWAHDLLDPRLILVLWPSAILTMPLDEWSAFAVMIYVVSVAMNAALYASIALTLAKIRTGLGVPRRRR